MADSQLLRAASRRRPQMSADAELMPCASHTRAAATARPLWCEHRMRERARIRKAKGCCALLDDCGSSEYDLQVGASLWQQLRFGNSTLFNAERRRFRGGGLHFPHSTCNSEWGTCKPQGLNRSRSGFVKIRLPWVANGKLLPKGSSDL